MRRTQLLLNLGNKSMELWDKLYKNSDTELRSIMKESNYNPCREIEDLSLRNGYRFDLISNFPNVIERANSMIENYKKLGYKNCRVLSAKEVQKLDPYLTSFCTSNTKEDGEWNNDTILIWRPGGCIDTNVFLPKLYDYLKQKMGNYINIEGKEKSCFALKLNREVLGINTENNSIMSLISPDGTKFKKYNYDNSEYIFTPGENVSFLNRLGFKTPPYAEFAGASLLFNIPANEKYSDFYNFMEIHQKNTGFSIQARYKNGNIFIGIAGGRALYGDKKQSQSELFCKNINLLQLNVINNIFPEFISLALNKDTKKQKLMESDLKKLLEEKVAKSWVGSRAVFYDGFPLF